jgi:long-chain acyl-CoA synthetase
MLTHRNMIANFQQVHAWTGPSIGSGSEVFVTALPLYHVFALTVNCFVPVMIGASNLLIPNPRDIKAFVKAMRQTPFTVITGVNTLFNALLSDEEFLKFDFSRLLLAVAGGMAVQRAVAERWKAVTGKPLIEAYGLTETSPAAVANPLTIEDFTGAIGLPLPSTDIAIRDLEGRDLPLGEPGELCIKGPQVGPRQPALASLSAAMSASDKTSSVERMRLSVCSGEVALLIGAVTAGRAMIQARATSPGLALWCAATASSASRMRKPRGLR